MRDVQGKVAIVTGGTSGIGLGIVRAFASAGMKVIVTYRRDEGLQEAMHSLSQLPEGTVHPWRLDVTDRQAVQAAAQDISDAFGKIHILCNNAGVNLIAPMDEATPEDWDWILGVNLHGVINMLVAFLPIMKAHGEGGHVINIGSMSCFVTGPGAGIYATSKFAVRGLSESLRFNLAPQGIGVSLVCPGLTQSKLHESALRRPAHLARTAFRLDAAILRRLADVHALGMDADEVGRKTLQGLQRGDFYILTHSEFRDELRDLAREVDASFTDEEPDAKRLAVETWRRKQKARVIKAAAKWREKSLAPVTHDGNR